MPEVMIPLVATRARAGDHPARWSTATAEAVFAEQGATVDYLVGTMIELPRAALMRRRDRRGGRVLQLRHQRPHPDHAGRQPRRCRRASSAPMSRRASSPRDPFVSLDVEGVGELIAIAAERGRATRPGPQARHLRRAWRRPGLDRLLRGGRPRLRQRLALPRADRPPGGGAGGAAQQNGLERPGLRLRLRFPAGGLGSRSGARDAAYPISRGVAAQLRRFPPPASWRRATSSR